MPLAGRVYMDANGFIYFGEQHPSFAVRLQSVFKAAEAGQLRLVTSDLSLLEVLVRPLQMGNQTLAAAYERMLAARPSMERHPVSVPVLRRAAELRAMLRLKTPDAVHIATAELTGCGTFLSQDRGLKMPSGLAFARIGDLPP